MTIFFMLLFIHELLINLQRPSFVRSVVVGLLLTLCFLLSYATVWLVVAAALFAVYLFFYQHNALAKHLFLSLAVFVSASAFQIFVLFNYLARKSFGEQISGSASNIDLDWVVYQLRMLLGANEVFLFFVLFSAAIVLVLRKKNYLCNHFLTISIVITSFLTIIISLVFYPVFLARQLVVFSLTLIFVLAQLDHHWRQSVLLLALLWAWGVNSYNGFEFIYQRDLENSILQHVSGDSALLVFEDTFMFRYYLQANDIGDSTVYQIRPDLQSIVQLQQELLSLPAQNVFFANDFYCVDPDHQQCMLAKESLAKSICHRHSCKEFSF